MSVFTIEYEFYNPRNPKCRACKFWKSDDKRMDYYGRCENKNTRVKNKNTRRHNAKACIEFGYFGGFKDEKVI